MLFWVVGWVVALSYYIYLYLYLSIPLQYIKTGMHFTCNLPCIFDDLKIGRSLTGGSCNYLFELHLLKFMKINRMFVYFLSLVFVLEYSVSIVD